MPLFCSIAPQTPRRTKYIGNNKVAPCSRASESELLNGLEDDVWELKIRIKDELRGEVVDMTPNMPCIATLDMTQDGVF